MTRIPFISCQGQGHGCGQRARSYSRPDILLILFLFISHQSDQQFLRYSYFEIWPRNNQVNVISQVKGQGHISYPVSNRCTSFLFHINRTTHSWGMAKIVFDLEKTHPKFLCQNNSFQQTFSKIILDNNHDQGNKATMFCCDRISGSHFIMQTSKFLPINATAMTLGQGHRNFFKVIQYISTDLHILCPKYLRCSWYGFWRERQKSRRRAWRMQWKRTKNIKSSQDDLITLYLQQANWKSSEWATNNHCFRWWSLQKAN